MPSTTLTQPDGGMTTSDAQSAAEATTILAPSDTPLIPVTPKSATKRSTSRAAVAGRKAVAPKGDTSKTPAVRKGGVKVATPAAAVKRPTGPAPKVHPFVAGACLVMLGDPTNPLKVKVVHLSGSILLDESIAEAVKLGAVTTDQVKAGHVFACQTRNVWQRAQR
jgi:hypothetical protein